MTQEEFKNKVSEEFMKNNQKIIEELKEIIKVGVK